MKFEKPDWGIIVLALIVGAICILGPAGHIMGATVKALFFHSTDNGDSARFIVHSTKTGDSIAGGTMSEDTAGEGALWTGTFDISDTMGPVTIRGYVKEGAEPYQAAYTVDWSAIASLDSLAKISLELDSARWRAANGPGAFSFQREHTDRDTLWLGVDNDTMWFKVYYHIGKGAHAIPDSGRAFNYTP